MRLQQVIFALALFAAMQVSAAAQQIFRSIDETCELFQARPAETLKETAVVVPPREREAERVSPAIVSTPVAIPTPLNSEFRNERYANTYKDAYRILGEDNSCSRFFGGPVGATEVLNRLTEQLKPARIVNKLVAIQMEGSYMLVQNHLTGVSYRLFEQVTVNSEGPFSMVPMIDAAQRRSIGHFRLNSRAGRALILLHELGHLVQGPGGRWLLPNDGNNSQLSLRNTSTIESHCRKQLIELKTLNE